MKWWQLTKNNCPKCGKPLEFNVNDEMLFCGDLNCGFQISQYRCERLVAQMNNRKLEAPAYQDNFSALQRMGTEPETQEEKDEAMLDRLGL